MPPKPRPLTDHQQEMLNLVKAAHRTHAVARRVKASEIARRLSEARIKVQREWDEIEAGIRLDVADEIAVHDSNLDEALIAAYDAGVPVRRIALDGFGNRVDGAVHARLAALRADGRVGNAEDYNVINPATGEIDDTIRTTVLPEQIDVAAVLAEKYTISEPELTLLPDPLVLLEESAPGAGDGISVQAVRITMDERDPYFNTIAGNARKGSPHKNATTATLYLHPATGELTTHESKEAGELIWDHPVCRFVKDHPSEVREEFDRVIAEA